MNPIKHGVFRKLLMVSHNVVNKHCTPSHNEINSIIVLPTAEKFAKIICLWSGLKCYYVYVYSTNTTCLAANTILAKDRYG